MLCFLPPVIATPRRPSFPEPRGGGAPAGILCALTALAALFTPIGWIPTQQVYEVRVGRSTHLVPHSVERIRNLQAQADGSKTAKFFASHTAYDTLPPGLELDTATGALVGVPSMPGSYAVAVGLSDGAATAITGPSFKVKVLPAL